MNNQWIPEQDGRLAKKEGWNIFSIDEEWTESEFQLQAIEGGPFAEDSDAWEFVWEKALTENSELHLKALRFLEEFAWDEYSTLMKWNMRKLPINEDIKR